MPLSLEQLPELLRSRFPERKAWFDQEEAYWHDCEPYGPALAELCLDPLQDTETEDSLISRLLDLVELLLRDGDRDVFNNVSFQVLDCLDHDDVARLADRMGPETPGA